MITNCWKFVNGQKPVPVPVPFSLIPIPPVFSSQNVATVSSAVYQRRATLKQGDWRNVCFAHRLTSDFTDYTPTKAFRQDIFLIIIFTKLYHIWTVTNYTWQSIFNESVVEDVSKVCNFASAFSFNSGRKSTPSWIILVALAHQFTKVYVFCTKYVYM